MYKHLEEITLNTWPAQQTLLLHGWVLRYAGGYTKRANSVSPLYKPEGKSAEELISLCEAFYSGCVLDTVFKITPYTEPDDLDERLHRKGYAVADPSSVRVLDLERVPEPDREAVWQERLDDEWLDGLARLNGLSLRDRELTRDMLKNSALRQGFFRLMEHGSTVACGLGVVHNGYVGLYDIVTDVRYRRRGMAQQLILNILAWGKRVGARASFLQVVDRNEAAVALYDKLGYEEVYTYKYRIKKTHPQMEEES
ncbi:GNAT family N-acetyltransferase [Paenibacillus hodogayensis]|uniref:GNAT family N-acetyltransferase n=1 Tax=Paenibacillus hodogayensis TaxID=279208 RepID=A0ABV5W1E1_9BACL